jgi:hypothetical protein
MSHDLAAPYDGPISGHRSRHNASDPMPRLLTSLILLCTLAAGLPAQSAEPVFPLGLRVGLVPPPGLVASTTFQGFEDRDRKVAMILSEMPPDAYPAMDQAFTIEGLKAKGIEAESREDVPLKEGHGFIVLARQQMGGMTVRKWVLIAGTSTLTAIVTMEIPEAAAAAYPDEACRASLATFAVRPKVPTGEQLALLPYQLREPAGFRIVRALADGSALLTDGPNDTITSADQPYVLIAIPPVPAPQPDEREGFARRLLAATPGVKDIRIVRSEALRIGGQPGHQVIAEAKDDPSQTAITMVQWLRFGPGRFLHVFGLARTEVWPDVFTRMRALRDGIEPK